MPGQTTVPFLPKVVLIVTPLLLVTAGLLVYQNKPWESVTDRAQRLCSGCGLSAEEIVGLIDTFRGVDRAWAKDSFYAQFDNPRDTELCEPCAEAILDASSSHPDRYHVAAPTPIPECRSLLGRPLFANPPGDRKVLEANLAAARDALAANPNDPDHVLWVGRRLGYLWRMNEAVDTFTQGIAEFPAYAAFYRHRGHRYISLRQFDEAIVDLERAAELIRSHADTVEPDGMPNALNVPLTTLGFNVWYHLGLARYLKGDYEGALAAYRETMNYLGGHDDNLVAVLDWSYMTLRRLGRDDEARSLAERVPPDMRMIENRAYHRRLLMYQGLLRADDLLADEGASELDLATYGYGVANWYFCNGDVDKAHAIFQRVVAGRNWPAFGFIAAEADLARDSGG